MAITILMLRGKSYKATLRRIPTVTKSAWDYYIQFYEHAREILQLR